MNITGKIIFCLSIVGNVCGQATLTVTDLDGYQLKQIGIGMPFLLKVHIDRFANDSKEPTIEGINIDGVHVEYHGTTSSIQQMAGQMTVSRSFLYRVRIDKEGTYTLGPAHIAVQGGFVDSNTVKVVVAEKQMHKHNEQVDTDYQLTLSVDHPTVYIGQKVQLTVEATLKSDANIQSIAEPDLRGFSVAKLFGPEKEQINSDGNTVHKMTWVYELYPEKEGRIVIPATFIHVAMHDQQQRSLFALLHAAKTKRIFSNSLVVNVNPLPAAAHAHAVGVFTRFAAAIDKSTADIADAFLYTLTLQGEGDFAHIDMHNIVVPDGLRFFASTSRVENHDDGSDAKSFEFVIQALRPGTFVIPEQQMAAFNPYTKKIDTIKTKSVEIIVTGVLQQVHTSDSEPEQYPEQYIDTDGLCKITAIHHTFDIYFPHWLFILLFMLPLFLVGIKTVLRVCKKTVHGVYWATFIRIKKAQQKKDCRALYKNILAFIAFKHAKKVDDLDYDSVYACIQQDNWHAFVDALYAMNFNDNASMNIDELFKQSFMWLKRLRV